MTSWRSAVRVSYISSFLVQMNNLSKNFSSFPSQNLSAHLLALAVQRLFPEVELVGGGVDLLGFYYDFIFEAPLPEGMLEVIESMMYTLAKEELQVRSINMMRENAQTFFEHHNQCVLADEIANSDENIVTLIQIGNFYSLSPEVLETSTREMGCVRLLSVATVSGGFEDDSLIVTRIGGRSERSAKDLKKFTKKYALFLKKQDHRVLGPELRLFSFSDPIGGLGVIWGGKGLQLRQMILKKIREACLEKSVEVSTPVVGQEQFLGKDPRALGRFDFGGGDYRLRSSFLQQHIACFSLNPLVYDGLPQRFSENGPLFSCIPENQKWGLLSQSSFWGEQTTIVCSDGQVVKELISSLQFIEQIITIFDFEGRWTLVAPRGKASKKRRSEQAVGYLRQAFKEGNLSFPLAIEEEEGVSEDEISALELRVQDVLQREWGVSRISVLLPSQEVVGGDKNTAPLVVLARQALVSLERFIALLIEYNEGHLPLWLNPEQVRVLAIGEGSIGYADEVNQQLQQLGLRSTCDCRPSKLSQRVHEAEKERVPYLILVGEKEKNKRKVEVRECEKPHQSQTMTIEEFLVRIKKAGIGERKTLES